MAYTSVSSITGLREQILANVQRSLAPDNCGFSIITSRQYHRDQPVTQGSNVAYAWVYALDSSGKARPIVKGPPAESGIRALEKLLEMTEEMVGKACAQEHEAWEGQGAVLVGDGFVLEEALPQGSNVPAGVL